MIKLLGARKSCARVEKPGAMPQYLPKASDPLGALSRLDALLYLARF
jgi:hypothetical protein